VALIVPFVKLGGWLFGLDAGHAVALGALLHAAPFQAIRGVGWLAGQAILAWLILAIPAVLLMTAALTVVLRRMPALSSGQ